MKKFRKKESITNRDDVLLNLYLTEISRYPNLSAEEEYQLCKAMKAGDKAAREKLICCNLRFIISVAKSYLGFQLSLADLVAEGNLGLIYAAEMFDETRGFKLISYAVWWIRHYIVKAITEHKHFIRLPRHQVEAILCVNNAKGSWEQRHGLGPTVAELSEHSGLELEKIRQAYIGDFSLTSLDKEPEEGEELPFPETIEDTMYPRPDQILELEETARLIRSAVKRLPGFQDKILYLYFGLEETDRMSIYGIAQKLGISVQTVQQNKTKGLGLLKFRPDLRSVH